MLKNIFLILLIFFLSAINVFADTMPMSSKSINNYGIGVLKINEDCLIYEKPEQNSKIIQKIILPLTKNKTSIIHSTKEKKVNPFIISIPSLKEFFVTIDEYSEENWIKIYYNQNSKATGWVQIPNHLNFLTWKEFFFKYGMKNGLYLMRDIPKTEFKLYSQDSESSQIIDEFTYPEHIALRMIRGNWMLITVVDTGTIYKTGWFQWRTDEGKLRLFPKMR